MTELLIVGAGLTGLSAAWHLARSGVEATVVERDDQVGGACRSVSQDGFTFDLTGHLLHTSRQDTPVLLAELGVLKALRQRRRRAGIALGGRVTPYPIQIHTHALPKAMRRDCLLGFITAREDSTEAGSGSFAAWVVSRFGEGFARHFFLPYNQKLYGVAPEDLTTEWVARYVPRPTLADVVDGALGLYRQQVGYNATFLYPRQGGIRLLADALAAAVPPVRLNCPMQSLDLGSRTAILADGTSLRWRRLLATLPLSHLAGMTLDLPPELRQAAGRLRAAAVINLNLGVRGPAPRREHWLYIPEVRFPFYRVGLPSNHGSLGPPGHHTLSVEVSVPAGSPAPEGLREHCLAGLETLGLLGDRRTIATEVLARIDPAYVVYDRDRPAAVAALRDHYRAAGVLLAGRWAEWKYSTMEDALWDGAVAARKLTS